jgi:hypothetical protein
MTVGRFRWRFTDDAVGEDWTAWHVAVGPCSACCCNGPTDGEHQEQSAYYDEDGILTGGHTRCDPVDPDPGQTVEYDPPR